MQQEIRSVELGICPMQLFHFWSRDVHPVQNLMLCTKFRENRMILNWDMAIDRFSKWRPSAIFSFGNYHFWSRDVHPIQNLLLCTNIHENRMIFHWDIAIYRFSKWNCFTTIRDHPRSLCCWPQLRVKFHVNLIHRFEDIAIWIFRIFSLKCLFMPPKWGLWTPKCDYSSSKDPKRHILA